MSEKLHSGGAYGYPAPATELEDLMRRLLLAVLLALAIPAVSLAQTATPTATAGIPTPTVAATPRAGAETDVFVARGSCLHQPPALATDVGQTFACPAPRVEAGQLPLITMRNPLSTCHGIVVASATTEANRIVIRIKNDTSGTVTCTQQLIFDYIVFR
jgi:hypothetical protein